MVYIGYYIYMLALCRSRIISEIINDQSYKSFKIVDMSFLLIFSSFKDDFYCIVTKIIDFLGCPSIHIKIIKRIKKLGIVFNPQTNCWLHKQFLPFVRDRLFYF